MTLDLPGPFKELAELHGGGEGRSRVELLDMAGEGILQGPEVLALGHRCLVGAHDGMEQLDGHNLLQEDIVDQRLGAFRRDCRFFRLRILMPPSRTQRTRRCL